MNKSNDYDIWLTIIRCLNDCNYLGYEDMHFLEGYFTACYKTNDFGVTPLEVLYEKLKRK